MVFAFSYVSTKTLEKYEKPAYDEVKKLSDLSGKMPEYLYFNKGL